MTKPATELSSRMGSCESQHNSYDSRSEVVFDERNTSVVMKPVTELPHNSGSCESQHTSCDSNIQLRKNTCKVKDTEHATMTDNIISNSVLISKLQKELELKNEELHNKDKCIKIKVLENKRLAECVAASASRTVEERYNDQAMSKDEVKGTNFARRHSQSREDTKDQMITIMITTDHS